MKRALRAADHVAGTIIGWGLGAVLAGVLVAHSATRKPPPPRSVVAAPSAAAA